MGFSLSDALFVLSSHFARKKVNFWEQSIKRNLLCHSPIPAKMPSTEKEIEAERVDPEPHQNGPQSNSS